MSFSIPLGSRPPGLACLPFLPTAASHQDRVLGGAMALYDADRPEGMSYGEMRDLIRATMPSFAATDKDLILCLAPRSMDGAVATLAAMSSGHAVLMADPAMPHLDGVVDAYQPMWVIAPQGMPPLDGYQKQNHTWPLQTMALWVRRAFCGDALHPDLFVILLTSGSTGSCKGVRLSYANIGSNTGAIIESLSLDPQARALLHLPLSYSFGLSVLNTHIAVGGSVVLSEDGLMTPGLWSLARAAGATHFPGVPYHYEMLMRLGLDRAPPATMQHYMQAGGKMSLALTEQVLAGVRSRSGALYIMYGQTEASPRISCFPLHQHPDKIGSSGRALRGGRLSIEDGEVVYEGPNVMMGYATGRADLALGDQMGGRLVTGDTGELSADGYITLTGRKQRFAKLFGQRISLDDIEKIASDAGTAVAVEKETDIVLVTTITDPALQQDIKNKIIAETGLSPLWLRLCVVDAIPHKPNGKIDYQALKDIG